MGTIYRNDIAYGASLRDNSADRYDPSKSYAVGDLCIRQSILYKCIATTTGEWNESAWVATTIAELIENNKGENKLNTDLNSLKTKGIYTVNETCANYPFASWGTLIVTQMGGTSANYVTQTWIQYNYANPRIFVRNYHNGTWDAWNEVVSRNYQQYIETTMTGTYISAGYFQYTVIGGVCFFNGQFAPSQAITNSTGAMTIANLPSNFKAMSVSPIHLHSNTDMEKTEMHAHTIANTKNIRAVGSFESGVTYGFSGFAFLS